MQVPALFQLLSFNVIAQSLDVSLVAIVCKLPDSPGCQFHGTTSVEGAFRPFFQCCTADFVGLVIMQLLLGGPVPSLTSRKVFIYVVPYRVKFVAPVSPKQAGSIHKYSCEDFLASLIRLYCRSGGTKPLEHNMS